MAAPRWRLSALFTPASIIWSIAASGTQPISHGGTLLHQQRAAVAAFEASAAQYRNTVLAAFQNVADVLRALADRRRRPEGPAARRAGRRRQPRSHQAANTASAPSRM